MKIPDNNISDISNNGSILSKTGSIPKHVAIIMDGNGRWAKERGSIRVEGHREGVKRVRPIVEQCRKLGIRYLTLFCFSTENWSRPELEVSALMKLFMFHLGSEIDNLKKNGVRLRAIGDRSKLPPAVSKALSDAEAKTESQTGMDLILALSYGSREEIMNAVRGIATDYKNDKITNDQLTEEVFRSYLYGPDIPDPDLLIRTSGEHRISNFLLWQLAYTELVITPTLWPDFTVDKFNLCIEDFQQRERRFGLTDEQIRSEVMA